ncbi:MAG: sulfur carrier protein ThiS [Bacteroidia bacterium]|nr:sulfur carrier protein ThiS [Bacteroidia bacterium]MDW8088333.1 sulfur carrier protein ThiS [Bacteroidia bacterium]
MRVQLNGEALTLPENLSVLQLLERLGISPEKVGLAVAVNRRVVPRTKWGSTVLAEGDQIELVYARQGG